MGRSQRQTRPPGHLADYQVEGVTARRRSTPTPEESQTTAGAPSLVGGVVHTPRRSPGGRGRKARQGRQQTPVSAGRRSALSFFLEEQKRQQQEDATHVEIKVSTDEDEAEVSHLQEERNTSITDGEELSQGAAEVVSQLLEGAAGREGLDVEGALEQAVAPLYQLTDSEEDDSDSEASEDEDDPEFSD